MALRVVNTDYVVNRYTARTVDSWDRAGDMATRATALAKCHLGALIPASC